MITGDLVIFAIGQAGDVRPCVRSWRDERGRLVFDPNKMTTSQEWGICLRRGGNRPGTVQAMANGRLAAQAILSYLEEGFRPGFP